MTPIAEVRDGRVYIPQSEQWSLSVSSGRDPYASDRCLMCHRPTSPEATRIMVTRTDDGEWWAVAEDAPVREDEKQLGDPHLPLPIGPDCFARMRQQFAFAVVSKEHTVR